MTLFGINFAIGVATGIILEFEFGTNWSNYSWMVGDIFGAPLAVEGIVAFFLEATFFAVMFFGWDRVSKGFHLFSTWMVAVGSNLSALWILVANGWMQIAGRHGLQSGHRPLRDAEFLGSPLFAGGHGQIHPHHEHQLHGRLALRHRHFLLVSPRRAAYGDGQEVDHRGLGLRSPRNRLCRLVTGDESAFVNASTQPMKLAAYEGLYDGEKGRGSSPSVF